MSSHPNRSRRQKASGANPKPAEIVQTREEAGLTQTDAAALLYTTLSGWQRWEYGERRMHPAMWEYFCLLISFAEVERRMSEVEVKDGEYFEGIPWKLIVPYESDSMGYHQLCRHAVLLGEPEPQLRSDGSVWGSKQRFVLPNGVAECRNEAGHNGTAICLECLDEARGQLPDQP